MPELTAEEFPKALYRASDTISTKKNLCARKKILIVTAQGKLEACLYIEVGNRQEHKND